MEELFKDKQLLTEQINDKICLIQDLKHKKLVLNNRYREDKSSVDKDGYIKLSDKLRYTRKELTILHNRMSYLNTKIKTNNIFQYKESFENKAKLVLIEELGQDKANEILELIKNR